MKDTTISTTRHSPDRRLPVIDDSVLAPLRPVGIVGGREVRQVGYQFLFSNDEFVEPLQRYPGERLPEPNGRARFPIPDRVGEYCSRGEFLRLPKFMAQWVHWPKRVECVLEGRYHDILPAHFEGIFTLVCNFRCSHCTRRVTRTRWVEGGTWDLNTPIERRNTMHADGLRRAIDQIASMSVDNQMGIIWGGGDPTANPFTYDGMMYARRQEITSSFLTNGAFLEVDRVLDADPILVRISLNCGSEEAHRRFHGYPADSDYFERAVQKMRELARKKLERLARTLVGISLIVDERNMDDVVAAVEKVQAVVDEVGPGIDYVICRPVMNYAHFEGAWTQIRTDTKARAKEILSEDGTAGRILYELGIPLIQIKDSFEMPPPQEFYGDTRCLAYGLCGEIRHNGDVQLCSDSYGNPEYTIGNLFEQSLAEIWWSERRREVLERINAKECYKNICPHNSRGHHHNRVFHQIEEKRRTGQMEVVRQWIYDLQETTYPLRHSFFI